MKFVVIRCDLEAGTRYVEVTTATGISLTFHDEFTRECLTTLDVAKQFMSIPGLDPRYTAEEVLIKLRRRKKKPTQ